MIYFSDSSDRELEQRVANYLSSFNRRSLAHLHITADNGTVLLRGRLDSFYEKQLALSCCRRVAGVLQLVEDVEVAAGEN